MRPKLGKPRRGTVGHKIVGVAALIWLAAFAGFGIPEAYRQAHDGFSLEPCAIEFINATDDRQVGIKSLPADADLPVLVARALEFETEFLNRVLVMDCPTSLQDELRDLQYREGLWVAYLHRMAEDIGQYDRFFVGIRLGEVTRSISTMTDALNELLPKPPVAPESPTEQTNS